MRIRYVAAAAAAVLLLGAAVTLLSFEVVTSEPPGDLQEGMTPIAPTVAKATTPVGGYMMAAGIVALVGSGIYYLARSLARRIGRRGRGG